MTKVKQVRVTKVSGRDAGGKIYAFAVELEYTEENIQELIEQVRESVPDASSIVFLLENME